MFKDKTFENLMIDKLKNVPTDVDKREGAVIYDAMAPNAMESALIYEELTAYYKETFGSTASRVYLIERCRERGIRPKPSSQGVYLGEFNIQIPIGNRFSLDLFNYKIIEYVGLNPTTNYHEYQLRCESYGIEPNSNFGKLVPIDFVMGLTYAWLVETLIPGEEEEDTEILRQRYFDSFETQAYGGNIKDYKEKTLSISGVGAVKVTPVWQGGGTVLLTILDSEYNKATPTLIDTVQEIIDPTQDHTGMGVAPIGHVVTVRTAIEKSIYVSCVLTLNDITVANIQTQIDDVIQNYLFELRKQWQSSEIIIVRISQIESRILDISSRILDIRETKINGAEANYNISENEIPIWGGGNYVAG